ncbi:uncharacterized protein LOC128983602 isoform X2 [Macrosteles quadrilineatus]|uniref:uncharacterized protein LOC128983602 isoform X2 n=1 Tax=Macrosteles quadrilineatus TaxID=74068 RepID=UPI0023E0EEF6|nr:uncharacterized protein LOC128983602 isoform X2 [Macrosteles quadrilineatus]
MSKSNTIICAAKNCYSSLVTHPNKSFFGFPTDTSLCKVWLENTGRTDLQTKQVSKNRYWRLCEDHFEDKWFTDGTKKVLKRRLNPIPTVLVNNICSLVPSRSESLVNNICSLVPSRSESQLSQYKDHCTSTPDDFLSIELLEGDVMDKCIFDFGEFSVEKPQFPLTYYTKPLLEPKELRSLTLKISENPYSGQHDLLILCRFCMNEAPHSYVELFSNTADAKEIRKISDIVLLKKENTTDVSSNNVIVQYLPKTTSLNLPKTVMGLPGSSVKRTSEEPYNISTGIDVSNSSKFKIDQNPSKYLQTYMNSELKNFNWPERSLNIDDTESQSPLNFNKPNHLHLEKNLKCYKKRKLLPDKEIPSKIAVLTQEHFDNNGTQDSTIHMSNYKIVNFEEIDYINRPCSICSEVFNSDQSLEKHLNETHNM